MRKILFSIAMVVTLCAMASCVGAPGMDGRDGRDGKDGKDGKDGIGAIHTVLVDVPQECWQYSCAENNNYFFADVDVPEIPESVFDNGLISVYRVFDFYGMDASQIELPYVRLKEECIGDDQWVFYTEEVDYEFGIGWMRFYYTLSDFFYELDGSVIPEPMQFRCVMMY